MADADGSRLLVQLASYNTNLQGEAGVPQNLVEWLAPTLEVSNFLAHDRRGPDVIAVGFQELLPLYLALPGLSNKVLASRDKLVQSELERHAPRGERYTLVARAANVGVALLVYARDDTLARRVTDVQTAWTGCGLARVMGNKGAVGVRFRVPGADGGAGETYTFVCAHLTPHAHNVPARLRDWRRIVGTLLFPSLTARGAAATLYESSHVFVLGDLNFRVVLPPDHHLADVARTLRFAAVLEAAHEREAIKDHDQLLAERRKGNVFVGLREGNFWDFKCSYKYALGEVDEYSTKRAPSWTDRIMYATYTDDPTTPEKSNITNLLYTSIPSYTSSDHKPVVALLLLPASPVPTPGLPPPTLQLPATYAPAPYPYATLTRYAGRALDRLVGSVLFVLTIVGAGNAVWGTLNFFAGLGALSWWRATAAQSQV